MMNVQFLHIVNVGMGGAPFKIGALIMNNEEIQRKKHETYLMIYMAKPMPQIAETAPKSDENLDGSFDPIQGQFEPPQRTNVRVTSGKLT